MACILNGFHWMCIDRINLFRLGIVVVLCIRFFERSFVVAVMQSVKNRYFRYFVWKQTDPGRRCSMDYKFYRLHAHTLCVCVFLGVHRFSALIVVNCLKCSPCACLECALAVLCVPNWNFHSNCTDESEKRSSFQLSRLAVSKDLLLVLKQRSEANINCS